MCWNAFKRVSLCTLVCQFGIILYASIYIYGSVLCFIYMQVCINTLSRCIRHYSEHCIPAMSECILQMLLYHFRSNLNNHLLIAWYISFIFPIIYSTRTLFRLSMTIPANPRCRQHNGTSTSSHPRIFSFHFVRSLISSTLEIVKKTEQPSLHIV